MNIPRKQHPLGSVKYLKVKFVSEVASSFTDYSIVCYDSWSKTSCSNGFLIFNGQAIITDRFTVYSSYIERIRWFCLTFDSFFLLLLNRTFYCEKNQFGIMTASKELLSDLIEKYDKVLKLTGEERKYDPPTEPYKSYYAARAILLEMSEIVKNHIETLNDSPEEAKRFKVIYAHITLDAGKIFIGTDETAIGEKYLNNSMHMLSGIESHPSGVCAYVDILNEYGGLWTNRGETEKAKDLLMKAESSYNAFKATKQTPLACQDLLDEESEVKLGARNLEKLHALTQFYLAQVYGLLGDLEKSAICCHTTLKMQLDLNEFDTIDWALNAATLSQYFCTNDRFTEVSYSRFSNVVIVIFKRFFLRHVII